MDKELLIKYSDLKILEKEIKEKIEKTKSEIVEQMKNSNLDKVNIASIGSFSLTETTTWKYSEAVKALQEEEKQTGIAEKVTSQSLRFTAVKVNQEE